ncbi:MAG: hypothetical protein RIR65_2624 [Planctomycetota bacterium]|jgi:hypothetical protein
MAFTPLLFATALALVAVHDQGASGVGKGDSTSARAVHREAPPSRAEITREELEHVLASLAADELEGRATASQGIRAAGDLLAERLRLAGVAPGGDEGTYFQAVPMVRARSSAAPELALRQGETRRAFQLGVDYDIVAEPLVHKGLVVRFVDALERMPDAADAGMALVLDGTAAQRREWLAAKGLGDGRGFGLIVARGQAKAGAARERLMSRLERVDKPSSRADQPVVLRANASLLDALRQAEGALLEIDTKVEKVREDCRNVVGLVEGVGSKDDPKLADTALVLSAHYDHVGLDDRAPPGADRVMNGADDDASGCAMLAEIAGAIAGGPAPARDVVFLFATAEEIGLVGTEYHLDHPLAPLERTVANLNFEMVGRPDPQAGGAGWLWFTGHDRTNLHEAFAAAALAIAPDPYPDQMFFERSDNYAFVKRGVVGQTFSSYNLHKDYHRVTDETALIDFAHLFEATKAALAAVRLVADGKVEPLWKPGRVPLRPR